MSIPHPSRRLASTIGGVLLPAALALGPLAAPAAHADDSSHAAASAPGQSRTAAQAAGNVLASDLIGMSIIDGSGREIGEVKDLLVRMNDDASVRLLASFDDLDGHDGRVYALQVSDVRPAPRAIEKSASTASFAYTSDDRLRLVRPANRLSEVKSWARRDALDWTDIGWWTGDHDRGRPGPASGFHTFHGSDLLGLDVEGRNGHDLGEIDDLVVDMHDGRARYAVVAFDPGVLTEEKEIVVPIEHFIRTRAYEPGQPDRAVVDLGEADLRSMKGFDPDDWPDFNDPAFLASVDERFSMPALASRDSRRAAPGSPSASAGSSTSTPGWSQGPARGSGWTGDVTPLRFQTLDANHDGFISRQEGKANDIVDAQWNAMDANKDGRLSRDEFSHNAHLPNRAAR
jgi:sporulation protein YlmC with PRC-barrel domain